MADIVNIGRLKNTLARLSKRGQNVENVVVGFTQAYALYVHEDMEARHPVGQAKYLEAPARQLRKVLNVIVQRAFAKGVPLTQCLLLAGLRLQREAQLMTPVDTGALKASAFTAVESQYVSLANANFVKSEQIRRSGGGV